MKNKVYNWRKYWHTCKLCQSDWQYLSLSEKDTFDLISRGFSDEQISRKQDIDISRVRSRRVTLRIMTSR